VDGWVGGWVGRVGGWVGRVTSWGETVWGRHMSGEAWPRAGIFM